MPVKLQIAVSRASLKFLWGWTGAVVRVDGVSPSVFRCTSTPMETGPIDACVET